jgi:hypothetical protein
VSFYDEADVGRNMKLRYQYRITFSLLSYYQLLPHEIIITWRKNQYYTNKSCCSNSSDVKIVSNAAIATLISAKLRLKFKSFTWDHTFLWKYGKVSLYVLVCHKVWHYVLIVDKLFLFKCFMYLKHIGILITYLGIF